MPVLALSWHTEVLFSLAPCAPFCLLAVTVVLPSDLSISKLLIRNQNLIKVFTVD